MDRKEIQLAYPGDEEHSVYPGHIGDRHRIYCKTPVGLAGYRFESNLKSGRDCLTESEALVLQSKSSSSNNSSKESKL